MILKFFMLHCDAFVFQNTAQKLLFSRSSDFVMALLISFFNENMIKNFLNYLDSVFFNQVIYNIFFFFRSQQGIARYAWNNLC